MLPDNHYISDEDEELLEDPEYLEALAASFESDDDKISNDDDEILRQFGY